MTPTKWSICPMKACSALDVTCSSSSPPTGHWHRLEQPSDMKAGAKNAAPQQLQRRLTKINPFCMFCPKLLPEACVTNPLWSMATSAALTPPTASGRWWSSPVTPATRWSKAQWWLSARIRKTHSGMRLSQLVGVSSILWLDCAVLYKIVFPVEQNWLAQGDQGFHCVLDHCRSAFTYILIAGTFTHPPKLLFSDPW